ncbi:hypothetical protein H0H81_000905 [Sphagnurus paluster]|uniref:Uncharacterized protein n=1 Tax=Sphagnurus paluster TaxID=117069 RepID=A0A9P7GHE9_9AGAR|nr:hypothetical protein H0H81_000905 [Sphagnurus paluster]
MPRNSGSNSDSDRDKSTPLFDENTTPQSLCQTAQKLQARLNTEHNLNQNLQRKFDDVRNTAQECDHDNFTSPFRKRRCMRAGSDDSSGAGEPITVKEAETDEVKSLGRRFVILHRPWLRRRELIFEVELDEEYDENERFTNTNTMVQGQLHEIRGLLPEKYCGEAFSKKWLSKSFVEGMESQQSNTVTCLRKLAATIFSLNTLDMSPSATRQEKFCDMIGWTTNQHGQG